MNEEVSSPKLEDPRQQDGLRYVHTTTASEHRRLERRTAGTSAAFLLPHLRPGMRLLDCGCGPGSITAGLAAAVAPGETIGLDLQPAQLDRARLLAAEESITNVHFELGSVYELPFPDSSFDAVFAHNLLVHLADPLRAAREMGRVLRRGGVIGIADDDLGSRLFEPRTPLLTDLTRVFDLAVEHHGGDPYRARHHRRLLLEAGFARPIAGASLATVGVWGTSEETREFAAWFAEQIQAPALRDLVTAQGWVDATTLETMADEMLAWGERPDAYFASMGVTALGWVDDARG